jgi:hypothetical protein
MSDLQEIIAHNAQRAFEMGEQRQTQYVIEVLQTYFDLTQESNDAKGKSDNPEWDAGFQAAIALIRTNLLSKTLQKVVVENPNTES